MKAFCYDKVAVKNSDDNKPKSVYGIYLRSTKRVLLVKDAHSMLWGFPGGGIEGGEEHVDTLKREVFEETGLLLSGKVHYITEQIDDSKVRYFYGIEHLEGEVYRSGNGTDITQAGYFEIRALHTIETVPGLQGILGLYLD